MQRRKFVQLAGMGVIGTSTLSKDIKRGINFYDSPEIIVIGAGTFGVWTSYHLSTMGAKVTLIDAYGAGNSRASSGGETRLIQTNTANPLYVQSALRSFELWTKMDELTKERLVLPTGALNMSTSESYRKEILNRQHQHLSVGIKNTEVLDQDEIRYRWPQMYSDDIAVGMYHDGGASGSTLFARKACAAVAKQFEQKSGTMMIAKASPVFKNGKNEGIDVGKKNIVKAAHYIFACGPWLPKLFPNLLFPKLQVQRRDVLFVGTPAGDNRFSHPNLPEWGVNGSGYYGFPSIEGRGLKVAPYPDYNSFDPDTDERLINPYQTKRAHDFVKHRFPALSKQPIIESRVCQVTNSVDGNFIVDQHPTSDNTWIVGGGSGHGFKHGPAIGEYTAKRILGQEVELAFTNLFKLKKEEF